ncbi:hypothetical protein F7O44_01825 [Phytoactinopolyspora sp. XMNu-373]|uniref:Alpha/beta hydrolase domain-containing protein n=2 Tax=Phytoactinopolyspora mesophila TaxID=2650750 RepID=A0A7K3LXQ5_9ACTN|nr:alpha/beta hydrolase domain-containing protein [Phytoactinopolyspora mesophila]NDL55803.1 hypothetical protein [Phytoactinopolyspora mesophila]
MTRPAQIAGPVPVTPTSEPVILEPYGRERMATYGYVEDEYFVSGEAAGAPYRTRILVRRPRDPARFSGAAVAEVSHIWGGTSVWRALNRHLMRSGHMWVEIDSQAPSALELIAAADPDRYASMTFADAPGARKFASTIPFDPDASKDELARRYDEFKARWWAATPQSFDIIAQVAAALRRGLPGSSAVSEIYLAGISQTGGVVRKFVQEHHVVQRLDDGGPVFDGYLPAASGGAALPDVDVPVIELLGEGEFQSVRLPCGVSGQVRGVSHRRADSDSFRLYEVAGMAHRETRFMSDADIHRLRNCPLPPRAIWSTFPNSHVYAAVLDQLIGWARGVSAPPPSMWLRTAGAGDDIQRDEHGNALGGLRTPYVTVPVSSLVAATPVGRPSWYHGHEIPFDVATLDTLYGSAPVYRRRVADEIARMIDDGLYDPIDAEEIRQQAERLSW